MPDKIHLSTAGYELWAAAILKWGRNVLAESEPDRMEAAEMSLLKNL